MKNAKIIKKQKENWSPEQIKIRLPIEYPKDKKMRVSYEAIYQYVYGQIYRAGNGKVKPDCENLRVYLPRRHKRRAQKGFRKARKMERMDKIASDSDLFAKKVCAKEIFGSNLLLGEKTVRPAEGGTPNSFGKMGGNQWDARSASHFLALKKPLSSVLVQYS